MKTEITATEAAKLLGVSMATLYSYVSRGLLSSHQRPQTRKKLYDLEEVLRLAARRGDAKHGGHQVGSAVNWGLPLLETSISHIVNGKLFYRGMEVCKLADTWSLEQVACLLWDDQQDDYFLNSPMQAHFPSSVDADLPLLSRALVALASLTSTSNDNSKLHSSTDFEHAACLMRQLTAVLLSRELSSAPLHEQLAHTWKCDNVETDLIRRILVLLADHELNASSFAVRCVASTGASDESALCAGIAAYSGDKHGGGSLIVRQYLDGCENHNNLEHYAADFFTRRDPLMCGFGHVLYPKGDPRASYLLAYLKSFAAKNARLQRGLIACEYAAERLHARPNMDCLLALITWAFLWPICAPKILFIVARSSAWLAHAHEQRASAQLIRPRARYVGRYRDNQE